MQTFSYTPDFGAQTSKKPNVTNIKFGDGYEQRYAFGMNTNPQTRTLSFTNRSQTDRDAILAFLDARGGVEAFLWTPPNESVALVWKCQNYSETTVKANLYTIQVTFEQVFEPS